jgi:hypothetical protein
MSDILARTEGSCDHIGADLDVISARMQTSFDQIEALLREILARLDRQQQDVPLHERGFGVMDEPPP